MKDIVIQTKFKNILIILIVVMLIESGCTKLIEIPPPLDTITTGEAFEDSANAVSSVSGIYGMINNTGTTPEFSNGLLAEVLGLYTDESVIVGTSGFRNYYNTQLLPDDATIFSGFWAKAYAQIYQTNACVEGLRKSSLAASVKNRLLGEVLVIRSFLYFQITNIFGGVPYITSTDWRATSKVGRSQKAEILTNIIKDVEEAAGLLDESYNNALNERIRVNKFVALGLLSKLYLEAGDWQKSIITSSAVIDNSSTYFLEPNHKDVFLRSSHEAILQWALNPALYPYNVTSQGFRMVPNTGSIPRYAMDDSLLAQFEYGDLRRVNWIDSAVTSGKKRFFSIKYKNGPKQSSPSIEPTEYYTLMRLAEIMFVRAEAYARLSQFQSSVDDINRIRLRSGLASIVSATNIEEAIGLVIMEKRKEMFWENGQRYFDLKRTGRMNDVLKKRKPNWLVFKIDMPIPLVEIQRNPFLEQNSGY
ncbi:RagB/SusD family nutrient uptake outer membrane protein [Chitinophaga rhizosphaerae]|uniref:RagB/SusD family nutrient uptake outer membrane protein n=1 Tax=Chitinophaga rhizosphaerae TaxID=1864947 RepID=UPI000F7FF8C0|nr:RagB/SusD family nutrient uptake outer membrane protein [Chitinophaga rhizosphaerae]